MKITLLGQGFDEKTENSVGNYIIKLLDDKRYHTFYGLSAFTSISALRGLKETLNTAKKHLKKIYYITGIDQKGTSKEALEELLTLGLESFVFYQPSKSIFHPKIYLFEGEDISSLIVGSSNLTAQGLFINVETSLLVTLNNSKNPDKKLIKDLKDYFLGIFKFSDPNLKRLSSDLIKKLVEAKIVPTELEKKEIQKINDVSLSDEQTKILKGLFPLRKTPKFPSEFQPFAKPKKIANKRVSSPSEIVGKKKEILWSSGPLTERDLNIPKGKNTNPTGSMNFKKGKTKNIDQKSYFREIVFAGLDWKRQGNHEKASAIFKIIIDDIDQGDFELIIRHDPRKNTRSYEQNNSMTSISWGEVKPLIAKKENLKKNANLISTESKKHFILEIK